MICPILLIPSCSTNYIPIISIISKKWAYTIEEPKMAVTQFVEFKNGMCIHSNNHKP